MEISSKTKKSTYFFYLYRGAFEQLVCPRRGAFAGLFPKNVNARGSARGRGLGTAGNDWCISFALFLQSLLCMSRFIKRNTDYSFLYQYHWNISSIIWKMYLKRPNSWTAGHLAFSGETAPGCRACRHGYCIKVSLIPGILVSENYTVIIEATAYY